MEDLATRVHAEELVAFALYLGTKVRRAIQRRFANRSVEPRIDGLASGGATVQQLKMRARAFDPATAEPL